MGRPRSNFGNMRGSRRWILKEEETSIGRQSPSGQNAAGFVHRPQSPFGRSRQISSGPARLFPTQEQRPWIATGQPDGRRLHAHGTIGQAHSEREGIIRFAVTLQKNGRDFRQSLRNCIGLQMRSHQLLNPGQPCRFGRTCIRLRLRRQIGRRFFQRACVARCGFANPRRGGGFAGCRARLSLRATLQSANEHKTQRGRRSLPYPPFYGATTTNHRHAPTQTTDDGLRGGIRAEFRPETAHRTRCQRTSNITTRGGSGHLLHGRLQTGQTWVESDCRL